MSEIKEMKGYKSFDENMKCRDFQYEVGKVYKEDSAILCEKGFHFCEDPISILGYYNKRFAEVSAKNVSEKTELDTKRVAKEIKIDAEISLAKLIDAGIKFRFSKTDYKKNNKAAQASGYKGTAQASGYKGTAQASGYKGTAQASGDKGAAQASGNNGAAQASGDYGAAQASGDYGAAQASGYKGTAQASGYNGAAQASGYNGTAQASGDKGAAQASGNNGAAQASGDYGAAQSGSGAVAMSIGYKGKAKGDVGAWLVLAECYQKNNKTFIGNLKCAKVDGETIEADTWYILEGGEFIKYTE